jgi:tetratricopeptide (TPR) repeat protein/predicted Ser/Thr protein kinase
LRRPGNRSSSTRRDPRGAGMASRARSGQDRGVPGSPSDPSVDPGHAEPETDATEASRDAARVDGAEPAPALPRGTAVGRYTVLSRLGAGGMGVVYVAYDPELDRKVALKLLRPGGSHKRPQARGRLLREAQALAKLAHPNVVTVHDVGEHEGEVWLAMELIDGHTLTEWRKHGPPHWTEILRVLLDAGRGVAAAHAAGLVHRDLKPGNVMVGRDGRVRVMDFGLARVRGDEPGGEPSPPSQRLSAIDVAAPLTRTRDVLGTPAYMAPEQWNGGAIDAQADQFSWCVMAWEALYHQRPFGEQALAVITGDRILEPPRTARRGRLPRWLRRGLERGLSQAPERRWPSMDALLHAMDQRRGRRRIRRVTVILGGMLLMGVGANVARGIDRGRRTRACREAAAEIDALWPGQAAAVSAALATSEANYVRRLETTLAPRLDRWSDDWRRARTEVCEAATLTGELDEPHRQKAEACLHGQKAGVAMMVELLADGDLGALRRAPFMGTSLPPVDECTDRARLDTLPLPQPDERGALQALQERWLRATTLQDAGRYDDALAEAEAVLEQARTRGWTPLVAQALVLVGSLHAERGRYQSAEAGLREAYFVAGAADLRPLAAVAAAQLVAVVGVDLARPEEGLAWGDHARMMMHGLGPRAAPRLALLDNEAKVHQLRGDHELAQRLFGRGFELRRTSLGADHPEVAFALRNLADLHVARGAPQAAEALDREALELLERALGPDHPEVAKSLYGLGSVRLQQGDEERARALYERALAVMERALGTDHPDLARPLHGIALLDEEQGLFEQARVGHERALAVREQAFEPDHPQIAESLAYLAGWHRSTGAGERAAQLYEQAIEIVATTLGDQHPQLVLPTLGLAELMLEQGQPAQARAQADHALALLQPSGAVEPTADARFMLARALWELAQERPRALELARQVRDAYEGLGSAHADQHARVQAWLAERAS